MGELHFHGAGWQTHAEDLATHVHGGQPGEWRTRWAELTPPTRTWPAP